MVAGDRWASPGCVYDGYGFVEGVGAEGETRVAHAVRAADALQRVERYVLAGVRVVRPSEGIGKAKGQ